MSFDPFTGATLTNTTPLGFEPLGINDPSPIWNFPQFFSQEPIYGYNPSAPHLSVFPPVENPYANPNFFNDTTSNVFGSLQTPSFGLGSTNNYAANQAIGFINGTFATVGTHTGLNALNEGIVVTTIMDGNIFGTSGGQPIF